MEFFVISTLLISLSLSLDAFAVSVGSGMCTKNLRRFHIFRAAFAFGLFQFLMPIIGWFLGNSFRSYIEGFDHWIAFGLLAIIGIKMIIESREEKEISCPIDENGDTSTKPESNSSNKFDVTNLWTLFVLAIATSIDAMAIGLSYSLIDQSIWIPAIIIGVITFAVCLLGFEFGKRIGTIFEKWAQIIGGIVLVLIGTKILLEHIFGWKILF
jgi:putative Mn2+ efflux pump MntP